MTREARAILSSTVWHQLPSDGERMFFIRLEPDGSGRIVSGGGQVVSLDEPFTWEVAGDRLTLRYARPAEERALIFQLAEGEHQFSVPELLAEVTFGWKLQLDRSPLPADALERHRGTLHHRNTGVDPTTFTCFYGGEKARRTYSAEELRARTPWRLRVVTPVTRALMPLMLVPGLRTIVGRGLVALGRWGTRRR